MSSKSNEHEVIIISDNDEGESVIVSVNDNNEDNNASNLVSDAVGCVLIKR